MATSRKPANTPDTRHYIELAKRRQHIETDYALAKLMGVSRQHVSNWQLGKKTMDTQNCFKIAELVGMDARIVIADIEVERAERMGREEDAEWWSNMRKTFGQLVLALIAGAAITGPSPNANAATARVAAQSDSDGLCIMSTDRQRKRRRKDADRDLPRRRRTALQTVADWLMLAPTSVAPA
jgi:transcriptional regulator with XRE-family HTH domain